MEASWAKISFARAPRLREARAVEGEDPHDGLDRGEELLLEVSQLVQRFVGGAEAHVVVGIEAPRLARSSRRSRDGSRGRRLCGQNKRRTKSNAEQKNIYIRTPDQPLLAAPYFP